MTTSELLLPPPDARSALPELLAIGCRFDVDAPRDTHGVFIVEPHVSERHRLVREAFSVPESSTSSATSTYTDLFGNICRRLTLPAGPSRFEYAATVRNGGFDVVDTSARENPPDRLPDETLAFLIPSRYCPSDELAEQAAWLFGGVRPGWERVDAMATWVNEHVVFAYGSSSPTKDAAAVLADRSGVCRDFAHLLISFCRAINVPARYVVGYLPDIAVPDPGTPMDFCAWTEVYLDDTWFTFDPRNHHQRRAGGPSSPTAGTPPTWP